MAYEWTGAAGLNLPAALPEIHKEHEGGIGGLIDSGVQAVLDHTPLQHMLEQVTGNADALHQAGQQWLDQAHAADQLAQQLRSGAKPLDANWTGDASDRFSGFMGDIVEQVESMSQDMAQTAQILNQAGQECQMAEDVIKMIIRELIEWAAMTLAATAVADLVTFGLATIVGTIAEGAEVAAFVARATEETTKLGRILRDLLKMLKEIEEAGKEVKSAEGLAKLNKLWRARKAIHSAIHDSKLGLRAGSAAKKDAKALEEAMKAGSDARAAHIRGLQEMEPAARQALGQLYGKTGGKVAALLGLPSAGNMWPALGSDMFHGVKETFTQDGGVHMATDAAGGSTPAPYQLPFSERLPAGAGTGASQGNHVILSYLETLNSVKSA
ncbi:WXG100 family type VII secretion target [Phaeacidiphilus oryzae]|uniref:WXG100 family type VII secretion target n=1 Tax=Phaeacidiphilus oryzae TaxID=348818 RepID=UPI0005601CF8|nr:WXG100 family type VII secretion target [Phaeacidiphilus oryzae]